MARKNKRSASASNTDIHSTERVIRQFYSAQSRSQILQDYLEHSRNRHDVLERQMTAIRSVSTHPLSPEDIEPIIEQLYRNYITLVVAHKRKSISELSESHEMEKWILGDDAAWTEPIGIELKKVVLTVTRKKLHKTGQQNGQMLEQVRRSELCEEKLQESMRDGVQRLQQEFMSKTGRPVKRSVGVKQQVVSKDSAGTDTSIPGQPQQTLDASPNPKKLTKVEACAPHTSGVGTTGYYLLPLVRPKTCRRKRTTLILRKQI